MTTKSKKVAEPKLELKRKEPVLVVSKNDNEETKAEKYARLMASPEYSAWRVIHGADGKATVYNDIDVPSFINELRKQSAATKSGDFTHAEAMLMNQATALQTLFANMVERASGQSHMPHLEGFMRLALKAQNQCRSTLETLAAIKNPPVIYAKQANISNGHQQINNGTPVPATRTGEIQNQPNELLEVNHGSETLDSSAKGATGGKDKAMATVG